MFIRSRREGSYPHISMYDGKQENFGRVNSPQCRFVSVQTISYANKLSSNKHNIVVDQN